MAGKSVATQADVKTSGGTTPFPPADTTISWTAGTPICTSYPKLTVGGQPVLYEVQCTFIFSGTQSTPSGPVTVPGSETVTLSASALGTTKLQGQEQQVLRDGDQSTTSLYGNVISISASEKLSSG